MLNCAFMCVKYTECPPQEGNNLDAMGKEIMQEGIFDTTSARTSLW